MPTRNVNLTDHQDRFVGAELASGRYQNASEVVRAGLRLLERHEHEDAEKLARLRRAVGEAEQALEAGDFEDITGDELPAWLAGLETTSAG